MNFLKEEKTFSKKSTLFSNVFLISLIGIEFVSLIISKVFLLVNKSNLLFFAMIFIIIDIIFVIYIIIKNKFTREYIVNEYYIEKATGLFSRQKLEEDLRKMQREKINCYILVIDFNGLKKVNDTFGHLVGDEVIVKFAYCLKQIVSKDSDTTLYRINNSGDEFAIISSNHESIKEYCKQIAILSKQDAVCGNEVICKLSCAYGVAFYDGNQSSTIYETLKQADRGMYKEKERQRKQGL